MFMANLQPAPPVPPENIVSDHDQQLKLAYEQWLTTKKKVLENQQKYYHDEVMKLRKTRKSLSTKQRVLKKAGNDLNESDSMELTKITSEQTIVQKQLETSRKQLRQHSLVEQEYNNKHLQKALPQMMSPHPGTPPAHMTPQSPLMSPSPSSSQSNLMQMSAQSPLGNPMMQPSCSPLHSPSPLLSHSPVPGSTGAVLQSPGNQGNPNMSPYNTMQQSPRIGTPHSQPDENAFSPGAVG